MKKKVALAMAGLAVFALFACSRVPDDQLARVEAQYAQLQGLYLQAVALLGEAAAGGALPEALTDSFQRMEESAREIGETVENRLQSLSRAEVEQLAAELDGTIGVMRELIPQLEQLRDLYAGGGLVDKTTTINQKIQAMNAEMQTLVDLVNSAQAAGETVPQSVVAEIQALSADMVAFGSAYTQAVGSMEIEAFDAVIEQLDDFIAAIQALIEQVEPLAPG